MENGICLRKVKLSDMEEVFNLSNQDYVRQYSINKEKIFWDDHVRWFNDIIKDSDSIFYVVTDSMGRFLGQIRYNVDGCNTIVSISLSNLITGRGYSKSLLCKSIEELFIEKHQVNKIIAYVSEDNIPSYKLFEKTGFSLVEKKEKLLKYIYSREE